MGGPEARRGVRVRRPAVRVALFIVFQRRSSPRRAGRRCGSRTPRARGKFPFEQTCCGQMHFNTGYQREGDTARAALRGGLLPLRGRRRPRAPASGWCASSTPRRRSWRETGGLAEKVEALAPRSLRALEFLVKRLGVTDVGAYYPHRVTYHPTCHSLRMLEVEEAPLELHKAVRGMDLVELGRRSAAASEGRSRSRTRTPRPRC